MCFSRPRVHRSRRSPQRAVNNICSEEGDSAPGVTGHSTFTSDIFSYPYACHLSILPEGQCSGSANQEQQLRLEAAVLVDLQRPRYQSGSFACISKERSVPSGAPSCFSCRVRPAPAASFTSMMLFLFISLSYRKLSQLFYCCTTADGFPKLQAF